MPKKKEILTQRKRPVKYLADQSIFELLRGLANQADQFYEGYEWEFSSLLNEARLGYKDIFQKELSYIKENQFKTAKVNIKAVKETTFLISGVMIAPSPDIEFAQDLVGIMDEELKKAYDFFQAEVCRNSCDTDAQKLAIRLQNDTSILQRYIIHLAEKLRNFNLTPPRV